MEKEMEREYINGTKVNMKEIAMKDSLKMIKNVEKECIIIKAVIHTKDNFLKM